MLGEVRWDGNICSNAGGYALVRKESPVTGWTTYIYEPRKMMFNSTSSITAMIIVAVVVALLDWQLLLQLHLDLSQKNQKAEG